MPVVRACLVVASVLTGSLLCSGLRLTCSWYLDDCFYCDLLGSRIIYYRLARGTGDQRQEQQPNMWGDPAAAHLLSSPASPLAEATTRNGDCAVPKSSQGGEEMEGMKTAAEVRSVLLNIFRGFSQEPSPSSLQLSSPEWTQLFLRYDVLVHLELLDWDAVVTGVKGSEEKSGDGAESTTRSASPSSSSSVVAAVCANLVGAVRRNVKDTSSTSASGSSNLAALALHVARMLRDLFEGVDKMTGNASNTSAVGASTASATSSDQSKRVELIGRARATCGALNLLRLLCHAVIVDACSEASSPRSSVSSVSDYLTEAFAYRSSSTSRDRDGALEIIDAVLTFLSAASSKSTSKSTAGDIITSVPELYDATNQCLSLLIVLTSTQLYSPMMSSWQLLEVWQQQQQQQCDNNYFLRRIMEESSRRDAQMRLNSPISPSAPKWTTQSTLSALLHMIMDRPRPPERSIVYHHTELAKLVAEHARGEQLAQDGMYEAHTIVMAQSPRVDEKGRPILVENDAGNSSSGVSKLDGTDDGARQSSSGGTGLAVTSGSADSSIYVPSATANAGERRLSRRHLELLQGATSSRVLLNATRGVLNISSTLLLLPFRLMTLALTLFGHGGGGASGFQYRLMSNGGRSNGASTVTTSGTGDSEYDHARMEQLEAVFRATGVDGSQQRRKNNLTNDVLWLTDSPAADLASGLFLALANNYRASEVGGAFASSGPSALPPNPFRSELLALSDKRWEGGPGNTSDLNNSNDDVLNFGDEGTRSQVLGVFDGLGQPPLSYQQSESVVGATLSINFESLFGSFGRTLHTEPSQLVLYTLLQSSPTLAASASVTADRDALVMPLLRTLYFASTLSHQQKTSKFRSASMADGDSSTTSPNYKQHFRSQSQLYVILILLLIFSQDQSFGPDAFRRVVVARVPWYRERQLRDVNLGSVLLLTSLRAITFNLHRLKDPFLLSNCCAVLLNISPHVCGLHSYAAMRLASVTVSCMKRYVVECGKNGGKAAEEGDILSTLGMYGETCRTLLQLLKHGVRARVVGRNLHLVYALVYLQRDFYDIMSARASPFKAPEMATIMQIISCADRAIQEDGNARTADETMSILEKTVDKLKAVTKPAATHTSSSGLRERSNSFDSLASDVSTITDAGSDFTFTYEEEQDPEIFFVPYIHEVIVCTVSASSIEWQKSSIRVFPLLEGGEEEDDELAPALQSYVSDAGDAV